MSVKRVFLVIAAGILCNACATQTVVYKSDTYTKNTVYAGFQQGTNGARPGAYDKYFTIQDSRYPQYQLVYRHAGDYEPEYDFYVAMVRVLKDEPIHSASATYQGTTLPVAVKYEENRSNAPQWVKSLAQWVDASNFVNILLTREQLIDAYEGSGKMIISLTADGINYSVVFPDTYLRQVLAETTNLAKYKMEEKIAKSTSVSKANAPKRELLTYGATFQEPYWFSANYDKKGKEERVAFDFKINNKQHKLRFDITYISQHVTPYLTNSTLDRHKHTSYVKAIEVREASESGRSCNKIKAEVGADRVMFWIECDGEYGTNYYLYLNETPTVGSDCSGCSVVKHL